MSLSSRWKRATTWALEFLTEPPALGRGPAGCAIVGIVLAIGIVDYATGIEISLFVFYLVPVTLAVAWLGWRPAVAVALMSIATRVVGDYLAVGERALPMWSVWNAAAAIAVDLVVIWIFGAFLSLHRELERRVAERTASLREAAETRRRLEHELLLIGSRERNAIGHELHDDICQQLVGTAMAAKVLALRLAEQDSTLASAADSIVGWLQDDVRKTRQLARGLLLASIPPEQLGEKLAELAVTGSGSGVPCRFREEGDTRVSDAGTAAQLFRIAQEAVRNALRHANCERVDIALVGEADVIRLQVDDDGCGIAQPAELAPGMGLRVMSSRAAYVGGTLSILPGPARGTRVLCVLPRERSVT